MSVEGRKEKVASEATKTVFYRQSERKLLEPVAEEPISSGLQREHQNSGAAARARKAVLPVEREQERQRNLFSSYI